MNRQFRIVSLFVLFASAMFAFTSSAYAAQPMARSMTSASRESRATASNVVRFKNGTTVTYSASNGSRVIQPYGRHAQPMVQHRDGKGRWMSAVASKVWGVRTWASSKK